MTTVRDNVVPSDFTNRAPCGAWLVVRAFPSY